MADPPWQYNDKAHAGKRGADYKYPTMNYFQIGYMPVSRITKKNCVLFLWATPPMMKESLFVLKHWGFEYKTFAFVWLKKTRLGKNKIGMGNYTRANAEVVLLGVKGKLSRKDAGIRQIIESIPREHSRKPDEIYKLIEKLFGNVSRIELFARHKRKGWTSWGNSIATSSKQPLK